MMLSEQIFHRSWVSSLFRYNTWPPPPGEIRMRQKLALVVVATLSVSRIVLGRLRE
jgi:hypothetical protein